MKERGNAPGNEDCGPLSSAGGVEDEDTYLPVCNPAQDEDRQATRMAVARNIGTASSESGFSRGHSRTDSAHKAESHGIRCDLASWAEGEGVAASGACVRASPLPDPATAVPDFHAVKGALQEQIVIFQRNELGAAELIAQMPVLRGGR